MDNYFSNSIKVLREATGYFDQLYVTDIGVNPMNFEAPYQKLKDNGDLVITGFDPQVQTLETLSSESAPDDRYLPYAVGDGLSHRLNIYRGSGMTSLFEIRRPTLFFLQGLKRAAQLRGKENIPTRRLDDISEIKRIDLLKIDAQGAEEIVFRNGVDKLSSAVAIHSEVNFFPLYNNQPSFGDIDIALRELGFVPHSFYHTVKRHVRSRYLKEIRDSKRTHLLDGDILYFRDLSRASDLSIDELCKMALIAFGVYGLSDYTLRCLEELERRDHAIEPDILRFVAVVNG